MAVRNYHVGAVEDQEAPPGEGLAWSWQLIWIKEECVFFTVSENTDSSEANLLMSKNTIIIVLYQVLFKI